ncbi:hypothetical protein BCR41DRAFT_340528 [Lobosporangium transversale]|uniref:Anp1-domain-containing protein n=1 Tax=Lobosporangium transversale TaxID=64571 RepID=A0A1Y2GCK9_9FUNG|nr:hypothetical protein BCR41DRAFT_340528 [Lobosporangium transversale]ORZ07052.1 hypothetical protein BCR41DRAFT_340528 [Lobosporangium transversale]|eukprot:XP_021877848.1 hypothetical protein BCR41DRAFT_340528 [Lobosporangium transversale]
MENPKNNSCSASVLILTPLMDAAMYLKGYFRTLSQLSYPKELISLGFLVSTVTKDSQQDPTLQTLRSHISSLPIRPSYKRITIIHQASEATDFKHDERHAFEYQKARRKELARCRNILLTSALMDEAWVLWLDVDVIHYSPSLLLELMQLDKDIVVPNCFRFEPAWPKARRVPYDRNNWYETTESMAHQRTLDPSYEQYHPTFRQSMTDLDLYTPRLVPLDGVGGTFTLVKAAVHRSGVIFPIEPVDHEIETEGMAKWAKRLGFSVFGIPHLSVLHA